MRFSSSDARLNLVSISIIAIRSSQDVKVQLMLFYIFYTNYNQKLLVKVRKPAISWDKFKRLALKRGLKIAPENKERENKVFICICFETRGSVIILIIYSEICL